jgi:hypothetical protein
VVRWETALRLAARQSGTPGAQSASQPASQPASQGQGGAAGGPGRERALLALCPWLALHASHR